MSFENILYDMKDGIATITFNRPQTLNAFTDPMLAEATKAFKMAARETAVRCVVLTGSGRGFSSGQDLSEVQDRGDQFSIDDHLKHGYHPLILQMVKMEKPIIGMINGVAAGAGVGVALACDLRIASEKASFLLAFSRIGLVPDSGTNWFLPRLIGYARAFEMAAMADKVSASKALDWGLVNAVAPLEQLEELTLAWANRLANGATQAFGLAKRAMNRGWGMSLAEALGYEAHLQKVAANSEDYEEGVTAFLEKRPAQFKGR